MFRQHALALQSVTSGGETLKGQQQKPVEVTTQKTNVLDTFTAATMHKRDAGVLLLAAIAMVVSLQKEGNFSFRRAWFHDFRIPEEDTLVEHHTLPPPVVADLNGDGKLEIVAATPDLKVQLVAPAPHSAVSSGFAPSKVIAEVSLLHKIVGAHAGRRPVALAVGHIDSLPDHSKVKVLPKQVLVVVTASFQVLCYDHNMKLMWERDLGAEHLQRHTSIKEVAVLITQHQVNELDRGLIVVGVSWQRGDLASGGGLEETKGGIGEDARDDEDVLAAQEREEAAKRERAHSAGKDAALEELDSDSGATSGRAGAAKSAGGEVGGVDTSRHFDYFGLEGGSGEVRWKHTASDFHKDLGELAGGLRPQNDFRLDAEKLEGRHFGEASCRLYRDSLLHSALPHMWSETSDTRLVAAHFVKHKTGRGAAKEALATKNAKGGLSHSTASTGHQQPPGVRGHVTAHSSKLIPKGQQQSGKKAAAGTPPGALPHHVTANALVAHLEEGLEVIHLFTGRPICQLHLPADVLHADINGDGVMDHVQVYRGTDISTQGADATALSGEAGGAKHRAASHCTAITTSGVPATHHLWQVNVCHSSRFLSFMNQGHNMLQQEDEEQQEDEMEILPPVFLPLPRMNKGYGPASHHHGLVIVLNSKGEIRAFTARGVPLWMVDFQVTWPAFQKTEQDAEEAAAVSPRKPTLMTMSMYKHGIPGAVLASGELNAVIVSEHGRELAAITFPAAPSQKLIVSDFNGDGLNDIIAVTPEGVFGYAQVQHVGGNTLSTLLMVAVVAMGLLLWNNNAALGIGPGSSAAARKLRSTEYTD